MRSSYPPGILLPFDFLWITVLSGFLIITVGLAIYIIPIGEIFKNAIAKRKSKLSKRKTSCLPQPQNSISAPLNRPVILQCPKGCCLGVPIPDTEEKDGKPVITGPQGHGFYTAGHWKIDVMPSDLSFGTSLATNPELMMNDYFAYMMPPAEPIEEAEDPETLDPDEKPGPEQHCYINGGLIICTNEEDECDDHSNDSAFMDMSAQSDADMTMMMF